MTLTEDTSIKKFFKKESSAGILLMITAFLAILMANSPLTDYYRLLIDTPVVIQVGALVISKPLLLMVNDGLMAVFFLLVGLELKREFMVGELKERRNIVLPGIGAIGGMAIPAVIYAFFNYQDDIAMKGWAVPTATDIAFALGVLAILGSRVPTALKVFLTSLAIFDDIGAILIIAFFYTSKISATALIIAFICTVTLFIMNRRGVEEKSLYVVIGLIMWVALLKSGVHATLSGVILAMFIPMHSAEEPGKSPLKSMEHDLHAAVAFFILPFFAFCNSGINLDKVGFEQVLHPIPLGIALGLFLGNQIGIFSLCWLTIKAGFAKLPEGVTWPMLYGTSVLCGIGFTMSLFIGSLAFEETGVNLVYDERLGIIIGSLMSGIVGYTILRFSLNKKEAEDKAKASQTTP